MFDVKAQLVRTVLMFFFLIYLNYLKDPLPKESLADYSSWRSLFVFASLLANNCQYI